MSRDFDKEWGFAPDQDYELRKCNKTPEGISKIMEVKIDEYREESIKMDDKIIHLAKLKVC